MMFISKGESSALIHCIRSISLANRMIDGLHITMNVNKDFDIFLATAPGLESLLCDEVRSKGFKQAKAIPGGVTIQGGWPEVWRANLWIRGASRVLARIDSFQVLHLAQLDKHAHEIPWGTIIAPGTPFRVEAVCSKSRIYHEGAAVERVEQCTNGSQRVVPAPRYQRVTSQHVNTGAAVGDDRTCTNQHSS